MQQQRKEIKQMNHKKYRKQKGSAITETGPALLILFLFLFFPLIDVISIPVAYYSCMTLNDLQAREASCLPKSEATAAGGRVMKDIPDNWKTKGLGMFVKVNGQPNTVISYIDGQADVNNVTDKIVRVETTVSASPFLTIPFIPGIPGLSAPVSLTVRTQRILENPNFASS